MPEYSLDCSLAQDVRRALDDFTYGYISAAMWTLTDDDGNALDYLGLHDIAPETIAKAVEDCAAFQAAHRADLDEATDEQKHCTNEYHGQDYWLTRNRHGAGFWDRGYSALLSTRLTDAAHADGSSDWYLSDDDFVRQL